MASYFYRFWAFLLDYLIFFTAIIIFYLLFSHFSLHLINDLDILILAIVVFIFNFCYFIFLPFFFKATLGRKIMKIKYLFTSTNKWQQFTSLFKLELFVNILPFFSLFLFSLANYFHFWSIFFQDLYVLFSAFAFFVLLSNLFFLHTSSISEKMAHIFFVTTFKAPTKKVSVVENKKSKIEIFASRIETYE